jgi:hypothetical protein
MTMALGGALILDAYQREFLNVGAIFASISAIIENICSVGKQGAHKLL